MVTDIIGNFIIRLKNANSSHKESVSVYTSKSKEAIADALVRAGFVKSFSKNSSGKMLDIILAYKTNNDPKINGVKRISKPSRRIYKGYKEIKPFKNGFGTTIYSTPWGVFSDKEAIKKNVGGEVLFNIW